MVYVGLIIILSNVPKKSQSLDSIVNNLIEMHIEHFDMYKVQCSGYPLKIFNSAPYDDSSVHVVICIFLINLALAIFVKFSKCYNKIQLAHAITKLRT